MEKQIVPDWRIVKVEQKHCCDPTWIAEKKIETCGVFYLINANLHIHICSFTPSLEAWPLYAYATFETDEAAELDEGETEMELMRSEEPVSYFGTEILAQRPHRPLTDWLDIPAADYFEIPEPDEAREYDRKIAEYAHEYFCGNPAWF